MNSKFNVKYGLSVGVNPVTEVIDENGLATFTGIELANASDLSILGGSTDQYLMTDGAGNLSWSYVSTANTANSATIADSANSVNGANVTGQVSNALIAGTVYTNAQPNITSLGTLSGITSNGVVNFTGTSNVSLGALGNVKITGGSNTYILSTDGTGNLSWAAPGLNFKYSKEFHVDSINGSDTTGDGSYNKPYQTIMKAHSVMSGNGQALYVHSGTYSENVTWTRVNTDIIGINDGGISYLTGTWTVSPATSSVRIRNVMWGTGASLTHNTAGSLYLTQCTSAVIPFTKSGNGYVQMQDCDFGSSNSFALSGSGIVAFDGGIISNVVVSNANAVFSAQGCLNVTNVAVTSGIVSIKGSIVYSTSNTANAITSSAGSFAYLFESGVYTPAGTSARVALAGFNSINSSQYDAANSTITGVNLGTVTYSDAINVRGVSTLGAVGNVRITGGSNGQVLSTNGSGTLSWANVSATSLVNGNSNVVVAANSNVTISVTGSANRVVVSSTGANITGNLAVSGNITAANLGNISSINLTGNASNVLYGNGVFAAPTSSYGNSNVATFLASFGSNSISTTGNITGNNVLGTIVRSTQSVGSEGGEIALAAPAANTSINTGVNLDVYQNKYRIFEAGGNIRGYYLDMTKGGDVASTNLMPRAWGLVATDTTVTLDDLSASVTSSNQLKLQLTSGSWQGTGWTQTFTNGSTQLSNWVNLPLSTGYDFASGQMTSQGNGCKCVISDQTPSAKVYEITVVRSGTSGNQWNISIERLVQ